MSEEVFLGGAFFDNNMPKWATEETMKRLGLEFKKDRTVSNKQNDKVISILGKIVQTMNKTEKTDRDNKKSLSDISKQIKESIKTEKEILQELKKSNKQSPKTSKKSTTGTSGGDDMSEVVDEVRDNTQVLEKIHRNMSTMITDMSRFMSSQTDTMSDLSKQQQRNMNDVTRRTMSEGGSGTSKLINESLESFSSKLEKNKKYTRGARSRSLVTNEISPSRGRMKKFNSRLGTMLASLGSFVAGIKKITTGVFALLKKIPGLGTALTAATVAIGAAMDFTEIVTQSFDNYRKMIDSGMNFTEETMNGARIDGIRMRKMISEAGLTFEVGLKALERNINMINELGVGDYFKTVSDVMGNAQDASSFMNRVMMSQDKIEEMTSTFLTNLKAIGDYERLNSKERNSGVRMFIRNTKMLSEVTGQSMKVVADMLKESTSDARLKVLRASLDEDQRNNLDTSMQAIATQMGGTGSTAYKAIVDAITDPTGGGLMRTDIGGELQRLSHIMTGDSSIFNTLDDMVRGIKDGSASGQDVVLEFNKIMEKFISSNVDMTKQNRDALLAQMGGNSPLYGLVADFFTVSERNILDGNKVEDAANRFGEETGEGGRTSRTAELENRMKNAQAQAEASVQFALSSLADSDASRTMLETVYKGMTMASDITERAAHASVAGAHALTEFLPRIANNLFSILGIMDDSQESREDRAYNAMDVEVSKMSGAAKAGRTQILNDLKNVGLKTELKDGSFRSGNYDGAGFSHNRKELKKLDLDVETLAEQANNANEMIASQAREALAYLSSSSMSGVISKVDRKKYRRELDESLDKLTQEQQDMFYMSVERTMMSGTGVNMLLGKIRESVATEVDAASSDKTRNTRLQDTVTSALGDTEEQERIKSERRNTVGSGVLRDTSTGDTTRNQQNQTSNTNVDSANTNVNITTDEVVSKKLDELMRYMSTGTSAQIEQLRNINQTLQQNRNTGSVSS